MDLPVLQQASIAVLLVGVVFAVWMLITGTRGPSRVVGVVAAVVMLVGGLSRFAVYWLAPTLSQASDLTLILILAGQTATGNVLTAAGLVLLTCAVLVAGNPLKSRRPRPAVDRARRR